MHCVCTVSASFGVASIFSLALSNLKLSGELVLEPLRMLYTSGSSSNWPSTGSSSSSCVNRLLIHWSFGDVLLGDPGCSTLLNDSIRRCNPGEISWTISDCGWFSLCGGETFSLSSSSSGISVVFSFVALIGESSSLDSLCRLRAATVKLSGTGDVFAYGLSTRPFKPSSPRSLRLFVSFLACNDEQIWHSRPELPNSNNPSLWNLYGGFDVDVQLIQRCTDDCLAILARLLVLTSPILTTLAMKLLFFLAFVGGSVAFMSFSSRLGRLARQERRTAAVRVAAVANIRLGKGVHHWVFGNSIESELHFQSINPNSRTVNNVDKVFANTSSDDHRRPAVHQLGVKPKPNKRLIGFDNVFGIYRIVQPISETLWRHGLNKLQTFADVDTPNNSAIVRRHLRQLDDFGRKRTLRPHQELRGVVKRVQHLKCHALRVCLYLVVTHDEQYSVKKLVNNS
ncbi:hypothetical protein OGAPHI_002694 [Ogataea philodendri]|uniref:Uncharacterized protein n=1 Tax=Ogataea philodendri TaxID=1378263 RepID=A0A9P8PCV8_9ASCO|nr:uncharacterized protein OGAPHI_002694 [Ogataea philodendri]KAH3668939.1 hypothetical protein OGAPHI_002694 [Ogataea philodendri]